MGRYDSRIKVYNGSTWKNVTQLRVYNGSSWVDLGNNDSSDTKSLYVKTNNGNKRITRNKQVTSRTVTNYRGYHQGSINTTTNQRYCFYNTAGVANTRFYVKIVFKTNGASNLFSFSANGGATTFELRVESNGQVHYKIHDSMFAGNNWDESVGTISVGHNQGWQTVEIDSNQGNANQLGCRVNGGAWNTKSWHTAWEAQAQGTVGSGSTLIQVGGLNINTAGSAHTYVPNDSYNTTVYDTNWV